MEITIDMIKELREKTGCGIMDCRSALQNANGDFEKALEELREKDPARIITEAVKGMLPRNKLAAERLKRLRVFEGAEHDHTAQQPEKVEVK